ncbi:MAG: AAA family ATPase [Nitrososphaeraceae archaeon]
MSITPIINSESAKKLKHISPFTIFVNDKGLKVIHVESEKLRHFIWNDISQQTLIKLSHLYDDDDNNPLTANQKLEIDRSAIFNIEYAIQQWLPWAQNSGFSESEIFRSVTSEFEPIVKEISNFFNALDDINDELMELYLTVFNNGHINFLGLMFALYKKENEIICVKHDNVVYAGIIKTVRLIPESMFFPKHINIELEVNCHNGKKLKPVRVSFPIIEFQGEESLSELGIIQLNSDVELYLTERGKKYFTLVSTPSYVQYTGNIIRKNWWSTKAFRSTGRAMVDINAMKKIDPNYSNYFGSSNSDDDERTKIIAESCSMEQLSTEQLLCMSPYVYGFSFSAKTWGEMKVDDVSDICFRDDAYNMLVLPQNIKDMLFSLVEINATSVGRDFIDGKGGGCIFLLAGSPGVGKTLTAEICSEVLRRPLYMVGVGELGTNVESLEENLRNILDIAISWNAVLLLDEADIFMEARDDFNIERNAMVGVFLRMLEYFQGTLFLTTNRAKSIDQAFYSRISLAIKYNDLGNEERKHIWTNVLSLYGLTNLDVDKLSIHDINGRQIKNVTRIVVALTSKSNEVPTTAHFEDVIQHVTQFNMLD